jgi:hypothetical protein
VTPSSRPVEPAVLTLSSGDAPSRGRARNGGPPPAVPGTITEITLPGDGRTYRVTFPDTEEQVITLARVCHMTAVVAAAREIAHWSAPYDSDKDTFVVPADEMKSLRIALDALDAGEGI